MESKKALRNTILTIALGLGGTGCFGFVFADKDALEIEAKEWATGLQLSPPVAVNCVDQDSDGDFYASCTVKDGDGKLHPIECGYLLASGCKVKQQVFNP